MEKAVEFALAEIVTQARAVFGDALSAAVLFGSAAEDRLRERSDVNLILVLTRFERERAERFGGAYRAAHAAIHLNTMFLLEGEVAAVAEAFAVKFLDIKHRHRVLFGADPFENLDIPPHALAARVRQVLHNLRLRMREGYTLAHGSDDRLRELIAESTAGLRAAAHGLLVLEGNPPNSPRASFEHVAVQLKGADGAALHRVINDIRHNRSEVAVDLKQAVLELIGLCGDLLRRIDAAVSR